MAIAGMLFFVIIPMQSQIKTISEEISVEKESLEQKSFLGQNIEKNISELSKVKKSTKLINSFIASNQELSFIESLEQAAAELSISQKIDVGEIEGGENENKKLSLTIDLQGDYVSLLKYLALLERSDYYININSLTMKKSGATVLKRNTVIEDFGEIPSIKNNLSLSIKANAYLK